MSTFNGSIEGQLTDHSGVQGRGPGHTTTVWELFSAQGPAQGRPWTG